MHDQLYASVPVPVSPYWYGTGITVVLDLASTSSYLLDLASTGTDNTAVQLYSLLTVFASRGRINLRPYCYR